jgi:hypothetical protein
MFCYVWRCKIGKIVKGDNLEFLIMIVFLICRNEQNSEKTRSQVTDFDLADSWLLEYVIWNYIMQPKAEIEEVSGINHNFISDLSLNS